MFVPKQVAQLEAQLFEQFFSASAVSSAQPPAVSNGGTKTTTTSSIPEAHQKPVGEHLVQVMEPLCGALYDVLRPLVVQLQDIDELCELVDILKHEVGACACLTFSFSIPVSELLPLHKCLHLTHFISCADQIRCSVISSVDGGPVLKLWSLRSAALWQMCRPGSSSDVR